MLTLEMSCFPGAPPAQALRIPLSNASWPRLPSMVLFVFGMFTTGHALECFPVTGTLSTPSLFLHLDAFLLVVLWLGSCISGTCRRGDQLKVTRAKVTFSKWRGTRKKQGLLPASHPTSWRSLISRSNHSIGF